MVLIAFKHCRLALISALAFTLFLIAEGVSDEGLAQLQNSVAPAAVSSGAPSPQTSTAAPASAVSPAKRPNAETPASKDSAAAGADSASAPASSLVAARALIARGHAAEALQQLDALALQSPVPAGVKRLRGQALYTLNRLPEAEAALAAALREAAAAHERDLESAQLLGMTLYQLGRPAEAIPYLEAAREPQKNDKANPSFVLALSYIATRRYDDARHAFALQYGFPPDSAAAYLLAARMLFRRESTPAAEEFARKALAIDPALPLAHQLLGEAALAGEHLDKAIAEFQLELQRDPLDGAAYDRLGDAYLRAGSYPLAQESLQQALLLEPDSTGPYILLGKVLLRRNDPTAALPYLERANTMDPANYQTHSLLAQAYRALGRRDDAAREMHMVLNLQATSQSDPASISAPSPNTNPAPMQGSRPVASPDSAPKPAPNR